VFLRLATVHTTLLTLPWFQFVLIWCGSTTQRWNKSALRYSRSGVSINEPALALLRTASAKMGHVLRRPEMLWMFVREAWAKSARTYRPRCAMQCNAARRAASGGGHAVLVLAPCTHALCSRVESDTPLRPPSELAPNYLRSSGATRTAEVNPFVRKSGPWSARPASSNIDPL